MKLKHLLRATVAITLLIACQQPRTTLYERARTELILTTNEHALNKETLMIDSVQTVFIDAEACILDFRATSRDEAGLRVTERMEFVYYEPRQDGEARGNPVFKTMYRQSQRTDIVSGYYSATRLWEFAELQPVFERVGWIK